MALRVTDLPIRPAQPVKPSRQRRTYTVEEWLRMPAERPYTELIGGLIQRMPAGTPNHGRIIYNVRAALTSYILANKLGQVDSEMNVLVEGLTGKNGWIPDLAFASKDNLLKIGENWEGVPDWVLEVWAGKRKETKRIEEKRKCWQQAGVPELWEVILQAGQHIVNVYRLDEQGLYCLVPTEGDRICSIAIAGFCIERSAIFANLVGE
jgi:Uma2 family endonuclease